MFRRLNSTYYGFASLFSCVRLCVAVELETKQSHVSIDNGNGSTSPFCNRAIIPMYTTNTSEIMPP